MSAALNSVILIGNATRDPEVKYLNSGTAVCELGLAINDRRKDAQGNWVDEVCFVDITIFGKQAEVAGEYVSRGALLNIVGKLKLETWEKDGQKRSKLKVIAERMQMLGSRNREESQERPERKSEQSQAPPAGDPSDIPFAWVGLLVALAIGGAQWMA